MVLSTATTLWERYTRDVSNATLTRSASLLQKLRQNRQPEYYLQESQKRECRLTLQGASRHSARNQFG